MLLIFAAPHHHLLTKMRFLTSFTTSVCLQLQPPGTVIRIWTLL
ncbi:unnamed protein product [Heligmosomoides polygyrus]|uniref:Uncharacterized protein n=1 Tax=Heligmosomoides polygyrus TaxID=6339 RepID=A0A3P7VE03_HELPZ|nr:unnamed protein product [Heligmosomoides polygyrus]